MCVCVLGFVLLHCKEYLAVRGFSNFGLYVAPMSFLMVNVNSASNSCHEQAHTYVYNSNHTGSIALTFTIPHVVIINAMAH